MAKLIKEFNTELVQLVYDCDNCQNLLLLSEKLLSKDIVRKIYKEIVKEDRIRRSNSNKRKEDLKNLLEEIVKRIQSNNAASQMEIFKRPEEFNSSDINGKVDNLIKAYHCFKLESFSSCRRAYELGCLLHDLKEYHFINQMENAFITWTEWFKNITTEHNIILSMATERSLRRFYHNLIMLIKLIECGLSYTELLEKFERIHNAIKLYPEYKQHFV